ncbi:MAG TPA: hypothetical protein VND93_12545, partial [Myxococcales bacterium]|nr:hypothetical protein [Myxococcales bacterium]
SEERRPAVMIAGSVEPGAPVERFALVEALRPAGQKGPLPSSAEASASMEAAAHRLAPRFLHLRQGEQD